MNVNRIPVWWRCLQSMMIFLGLLILLPVSAQVVPKLNWGHVLLKSRSSSAIQAAFPQAMRQVLIKYSGQVDVDAMPQINQFLSNANQLVLRYAFESHPDTPDMPWQLNVAFDKKAVEQYLLNSGLSLWNADRPATLCFIYINDGRSSQVLSAHDAPLQSEYMQTVAKQRGVPLVWPLYDVQDQMHISVRQPPTRDQNVASLSVDLQQYWRSRYQLDSLLYGVVWHANDHWQGEWYAAYNGSSTSWQESGTDVNTVLGESVAHLANFLASKMSVHAQAAGQITRLNVWVANVRGLHDYAAVLRYFKHLSPVSGVGVLSVRPGGVLLAVDTPVGASGLAKVLRQQRRLSPLLLPIPSGSPPAAAYFSWNSVG